MRPILKLGPPGALRVFFSLQKSSFGTPGVDPVSFGVRAPLAMILGALERGRSHLSPGSKILKNDLLVLFLQHERCSRVK